MHRLLVSVLSWARHVVLLLESFLTSQGPTQLVLLGLTHGAHMLSLLSRSGKIVYEGASDRMRCLLVA